MKARGVVTAASEKSNAELAEGNAAGEKEDGEKAQKEEPNESHATVIKVACTPTVLRQPG